MLMDSEISKLYFDAIVALTALYGALTGTIALYLQIIGIRKDKAELHLSGRVVFGGELGKYLELTVTNIGRRVIRLDSIGIDFAPMEDPPDSRILSSRLSIVLFDFKKKGVISLEEGDKRTFDTADPFHQSPLINEDGEHTVYVSTTAGRKYTLSFSRYAHEDTGILIRGKEF
jgi:hypothetical protein